MFALIGLFTFGVMLIPSSVSTTFASIYTLLPAAVTMTLYGHFMVYSERTENSCCGNGYSHRHFLLYWLAARLIYAYHVWNIG